MQIGEQRNGTFLQILVFDTMKLLEMLLAIQIFFRIQHKMQKLQKIEIFGRLGRSIFTSFGAEYYLTENSSIIGNIIFNGGNDDDVNTNKIDRFNVLGDLNEATFRTESESESEQRVQYTLDYVNNFDNNGKNLRRGQYSSEIEDILNDITEIDTQVNLLNDLEQVLENQNENSGLLQIDYVNPRR